MRIQILLVGFKGLKIILINQACHRMREETPFSPWWWGGGGGGGGLGGWLTVS